MMPKYVLVVETKNRIDKIINSYTFGPYTKEGADKAWLLAARPDRNVFIEILRDPTTLNILKDDNAF